MTLEERELIGAKLKRDRQQLVRKRKRQLGGIVGGVLVVVVIVFMNNRSGEKFITDKEQVDNGVEQSTNNAGTQGAEEGVTQDPEQVTGAFADAQVNYSVVGTDKKLEMIHQSEAYPDALVELVDKNIETLEFVYQYPENKDKKWNGDLAKELAQNTIWDLCQWDARWGYEPYSGGFMGQTGCGPTCLSVVALHLLQDATMTPIRIKEFSQANGYSVDGQGSTWTLFSEGATKLGLETKELPLMKNSITDTLDAGKLIVMVVKQGDFTTEGHFLVIRGWDENGLHIYDPNSRVNTQKQWTYEEIEGQINALWSVGIGY